MAVSPAEVLKIAHLARIAVSEEDVAITCDQINDILKLIEQLKQVDTTGVAPLAHPLEAKQRLRPDCVTESNQRDDYMAIANGHEAGLYLVPKVVE